MPVANPLQRFMSWLNYEEADNSKPSVSSASETMQHHTVSKRQNSNLKINHHEKIMVIRHPKSFADREIIADDIKIGNMVTVDFSNLSNEEMLYFRTYCEAIIYALDAKAQKVSANIMVYIPIGYAVTNDINDEQDPPTPRRSSKSNDVPQEKFVY